MKQPFKTYNGGKSGSGVYQAIINQIPPHKWFISGFAGNCGVLANKLPASMANIAIDVDAAVIQGWHNIPGITPIKADSTHYISDLLQLLPSDIVSQIFVFLDPPYLSETRRSDQDYYKYEMCDHASHEKLLLEAKKWPVPTLITHYPCNFYDDLLSGWRTKDIKGRTRKGIRTERLYMNYPEPTELHDYRYFGEDFRERELYRKMQNNIIAKLERLSAIEKNFLLDGLRKAGKI